MYDHPVPEAAAERARALAVLAELRVLADAGTSRRLAGVLTEFDDPAAAGTAGITGYARGWAMCVPDTFRAAFDIDPVKHRQGWRFQFRRGHTVYDHREAYEAITGGPAVRVTACLQVTRDSTPVARALACRLLTADPGSGRLVERWERTVDVFDLVRMLIAGPEA
ncbi:MAG: hypothetical protein ABIF71_08005 [Planctomycetota bacterium]